VRVIVAWLCACARYRRIGRHQNSFNRITEDTAQHDRFRCPIAFHRQCSGPQTRQACQHCHENCGSASADLQETDKDVSTSSFPATLLFTMTAFRNTGHANVEIPVTVHRRGRGVHAQRCTTDRVFFSGLRPTGYIMCRIFFLETFRELRSMTCFRVARLLKRVASDCTGAECLWNHSLVLRERRFYTLPA
jgi:hypothetical protein